jgi:hypothetical protein
MGRLFAEQTCSKTSVSVASLSAQSAVVATGYGGQNFQAGQQGGSSQGSATVPVTNCSPNLYVANNGSQISAGQGVSITSAPQMPAISVSLVAPVPCALPTGTAAFGLSTSYPGGSYSWPSPPPEYLTASQPVSLPASPFYGGYATINWTYNGASMPPFNFTIQGGQLDTSAVQGFLGGGWASNIGMHESGLQQFALDGNNNWMPIKDYAGGFGIMQLTNPAPTVDQQWNWQSNATVGQALLATDLANALNFYSNQIGQWNAWNNNNPGSYVPPEYDYWAGGCCVFSMRGTGTTTYDVAIGLKRYAAGYIGGNFLSWNLTPGQGINQYWLCQPSYSYTNANGQLVVVDDIVYQFASCDSASDCQHSGSGYLMTP